MSIFGNAIVVLLAISLVVTVSHCVGTIAAANQTGNRLTILGHAGILVFIFVGMMGWIWIFVDAQKSPPRAPRQVYHYSSRTDDKPPAIPMGEGVEVPADHLDEPEETDAAEPPKAAAEAPADEPDRPEWLTGPLGLQGDVYRVRVEAGPHPRRIEAENELQEAVAAAIDEWLEAAIAPGAAEQVALPAEFVRGEIVREQYSETQLHRFSPLEEDVPMIRLHAMLEFGPKVRAEAQELYREAVVERRLVLAGGSLGGILLLLGGTFGYLRLTGTKG